MRPMHDDTRALLRWHDRKMRSKLGFNLHPTDLADTLADTPRYEIPARLQEVFAKFKKRRRTSRISVCEHFCRRD